MYRTFYTVSKSIVYATSCMLIYASRSPFLGLRGAPRGGSLLRAHRAASGVARGAASGASARHRKQRAMGGG